MQKTIEYYLQLPYTIELVPEPDGSWFVAVKELPGCMSGGDTPEEAIEMIQDAMRGWLEVSLEDGDPIPEPRELDAYSGKFVVRVPRSLHRELVEAAEEEGVSLNQYINVALARAVADPPPRAGQQGPAAGVAVRKLAPVPPQASGRPAGAASILQEEPGRYSAGDEEANDLCVAEPTGDEG